MPESDRGSIHRTASSLSKNPLGIIALFIVLIYSISSIVILFGSYLSAQERIPIIYFLVIFPFFVLFCFTYLVSFKSIHLFSPSDFRDQQHYFSLHQIQMTISNAIHTAVQQKQNKIDPSDNNLNTQPPCKKYRNVNLDVAAEISLDRDIKIDILWVDDFPEENQPERDAIKLIGARFVNVENTQEALNLIKNNDFSLIISDMGRREGNREGYVLLEKIREKGMKIPFFLYTSSNSEAHKMEALRNGAQGATNDPGELFQMIVDTVRQTADRRTTPRWSAWQ